MFSNVVEGVESISGLIARYTIFEKLYLHEDCEATLGLHGALRKLYAAMLTYLAKIKSYLTGNSWSMCLSAVVQERIKHKELMLIFTFRAVWPKLSRSDV